jgi:xanthine dehydrogenase YagR molybdenum-binding subunit
MANAAAPVPKANMGEPAVRLDARLKVTGDAHYPSDVPVGNPAYACLVTSTIARGRIKRLALGAAFAVPGVLDILTEDNTSELKNVAFSPRGGGASEKFAYRASSVPLQPGT